MTRRTAALAVTALVLAPAACGSAEPPQGTGRPPVTTTAPSGSPSPVTAPARVLGLSDALAPLEAEHGARIGVHAVDTGTGTTASSRADERFPHASTMKALLVGVVLATVPDDRLDAPVGDGTALAPPTEVGDEYRAMTVRELAAAAMVESSNPATNLLLALVGGPAGLQGELRALGDRVTRTDRWEPELNDVAPGDDRDTTSPRALSDGVAGLAVGDVLEPGRRGLFQEWLRESTTGTDLVRAAAPDGWVVGDRSGQAGHGTRNDVAVLWPPDGEPVVVAVLTTHDDAAAEPSDALVAEVAAVALEALAG